MTSEVPALGPSESCSACALAEDGICYPHEVPQLKARISELRAEVALAIEMLDTIPTDPKMFARRAGTCIPLVRGGLARVLAETSVPRIGLSDQEKP